jgi:iron complex transport system ATP-binding protein
MTLIKLDNVTFAYENQTLLRNFSLSIQQGEFLGIIGPNGAGKSTILKLFTGILKPNRGRAFFENKPVDLIDRKEFARKVGFLGQQIYGDFDYTAYEIAAMGRYPYQTVWQGETPEDSRIIEQTMRETEVWELRDRMMSQLSGGERQRVMLASALCQQPELLLLDEPTSALDLHHQYQFFEIIRKLFASSLAALVMVTHDINLAARYATRIVVMAHGKIEADGTPESVITASLLKRVYGIDAVIVPHPMDHKPVVTLP